MKEICITALADELDRLQSGKNNGRGVSCIQTIIIYLRIGDIDKAKAVYFNEGDKINNYPDIEKLLQDELLEASEWRYRDGK